MLLDSMTDGIVVTDRDHRLMLHNKSAERLFPFEGDDLGNRPLWDCLGDKDLSEFFSAKLRGQEKVSDREFTLGNGSPRIVSVSILPLVSQGSVQGTVVHVEDVTEKRSKEARLRRAESLASLTTLAGRRGARDQEPPGVHGHPSSAHPEEDSRP